MNWDVKTQNLVANPVPELLGLRGSTLASEHIAAMHLDRRVEACIQHQRFELPQQSGYVSAQFCNESVQGSLNLLEITGVVKLDINDRWTFDRRKATSLALPRMSARVWPGPRGVVNDFEAYY